MTAVVALCQNLIWSLPETLMPYSNVFHYTLYTSQIRQALGLMPSSTLSLLANVLTLPLGVKLPILLQNSWWVPRCLFWHSTLQ